MIESVGVEKVNQKRKLKTFFFLLFVRNFTFNKHDLTGCLENKQDNKQI